jgi:hypothetical protein
MIKLVVVKKTNKLCRCFSEASKVSSELPFCILILNTADTFWNALKFFRNKIH